MTPLPKKTLINGLLAWMLLGAVPAGAEHVEPYQRPAEPQREFPADFAIPLEAQSEGAVPPWSQPTLGGWGGAFDAAEPCPAGHVPRTPVVFVHGTSEDAYAAWRATEYGESSVNVRQRFLDAGWCAAELWGVSYSGARGYFTYNDANAEEVYAFVQAVLGYTGAPQVDVVAHSLGVTVLRKAMRNHIESLAWLRRLVAIAGGNHGTTVCRPPPANHACEELQPASPWLADLNSVGETPPGRSTS